VPDPWPDKIPGTSSLALSRVHGIVGIAGMG